MAEADDQYEADRLESAAKYGELKGVQAANQMALNLYQSSDNITWVRRVASTDDPFGRMAEGGGSAVYSGGEYDNFRRSENIEDRRKQKLSQNPFVNDADYEPLSALVAKDAGLREWFYGDPAAYKNILSRALGITDLIKREVDKPDDNWRAP